MGGEKVRIGWAILGVAVQGPVFTLVCPRPDQALTRNL